MIADTQLDLLASSHLRYTVEMKAFCSSDFKVSLVALWKFISFRLHRIWHSLLTSATCQRTRQTWSEDTQRPSGETGDPAGVRRHMTLVWWQTWDTTKVRWHTTPVWWQTLRAVSKHHPSQTELDNACLRPAVVYNFTIMAQVVLITNIRVI